MKVKSESEVAQSCPTLSDPMDYSLPGSSVHGIFQARVLEWGALAFSRPCRSSNKYTSGDTRVQIRMQVSTEKLEMWSESGSEEINELT